jgi:uncharacterized protein
VTQAHAVDRRLAEAHATSAPKPLSGPRLLSFAATLRYFVVNALAVDHDPARASRGPKERTVDVNHGEGRAKRSGHDRSRNCTKGLPPVHLWDPPYCGEIDMRIASDGTWFYQKTPIGRPALVKLFASVLKREGDRYFLVTPVEKCGITVEDAPFLATEMKTETSPSGRVLRFVTNVGDEVPCGPDHPLRFEPETGTGGLKPYLLVRRNLWAKVTRALFYDLVELGEERSVEGVRLYGLVSQGHFFPMAPVENLMDIG